MTSNDDTSAPVPFHTDERTLTEKLRVDRRNWEPHKPGSGSPPVIFGLCIERGKFTSQYDPLKTHPTMRLLTADNIAWGVVGFHGWLEREIESKNPQPGDFVACAWTGTRPSKRAGESDANTYAVEVERHPDRPAPLEPERPSDDERELVGSTAGTPDAQEDDIPF